MTLWLGIPILKFYIFSSGAEGKLWGLLAAVIAGSGLGLYYYLRIIVIMSMPTLEQTPQIEAAKYHDAWISTTTLIVLTVLLVRFGIFQGIQSPPVNKLIEMIPEASG